MSTITGKVTATVVLGSGGYGTSLTITGTGAIDIATHRADGIDVLASVVGGIISNAGTINAGIGVGNAQGGIGINLYAAADITNTGSIAGGGESKQGAHGAGALGIDMRAGGSLANAGQITGGNGGDSKDVGTGNRYYGLNGGDGVRLVGATLDNTGEIVGGSGGQAYYGGGNGGNGVDLSAGSRGSNEGTILGGGGGSIYGFGGIGVVLNGSTLINTGTIMAGGAGSGHGESRVGPPDHNVHAPILPSAGAGVYLTHGALLDTSGTIIGGGAGDYAGNGSSGVVVDNSVIDASGLIVGGYAGHNAYYGTNGGIGVQLNGGTALLSGTVQGGMSSGYPRGYGGVGVQINGGSAVNTGTISGGNDTFSDRYAGNAAGVTINGGTLTNHGTISGGTIEQGGVTPAAVYFGSDGGTLIVDPGAVFNGDVIAKAGTSDALVLAGTQPATLSGLGTQFTGFDTLTVENGAHWTLAGSASGAVKVTLDDKSSLTAAGALSVDHVGFDGAAQLVLDKLSATTSQITTFGTGDTVDLAKLDVTSFTFAKNTMTLMHGGSTLGTLVFLGSYTAANFALASDGHGGTMIDFVASAFAPIVEGGSNEFAAARWIEAAGHLVPDRSGSLPLLLLDHINSLRI